ncbi:hypothetical protein [Aestuariivirga litoralis]|uniref:hypothetical protein n=1 Tax=Aestuariivirga litoralis TaxID=2650924 RepID=UPI0018C6B335|nr:hypothetical protein [Aestuariivirga litoralis]MBG1230899.1 hypothetical protein [Aestuariivirga litoralis]
MSELSFEETREPTERVKELAYRILIRVCDVKHPLVRRPGEVLHGPMLLSVMTAGMFKQEELKAAVDYMVVQGWIESADRFHKLTSKGLQHYRSI